MELSWKSEELAALREALELEIVKLQKDTQKWAHLRKYGTVSSWNEVNDSYVLATRVFKTQTREVAA